MNWFRTTLLLTLLTLLFVMIGRLIGGHEGVVIAFILAVVMNFGAYWFSDKIVLASYGATPVTSEQAPELYYIVNDLAGRVRMPMPKVYIINEATPNAFATGRNPEHAAVAVTTGILNILNREELTGVLAHELSHVRHRDTLISAIAATFAGAIATIANIAQWGMIFGFGRHNEEGEEGLGIVGSLLMIIIAPIAATLIQLAVSRSREYEADKGGAEMSGNPLALANALKKLEMASKQIPFVQAENHPATAHLFIVNPLNGNALKSLFSTHPSTEERIKRLEAMVYRT